MLALTDYQRWVSVVQNGTNRSDLLTVNEEQFVGSLLDKFARYKRDTYLTEKQLDWLESIETKLHSEMGSTYEDYRGN